MTIDNTQYVSRGRVGRIRALKPRTYRLERNAERYAAKLRKDWPARRFFVTVRYDFRFVVATYAEDGARVVHCS